MLQSMLPYCRLLSLSLAFLERCLPGPQGQVTDLIFTWTSRIFHYLVTGRIPRLGWPT